MDMQQYEQEGSPSRVFFTVSDMNATSSDTSYGCISELIRITVFVCRGHHTLSYVDPQSFGVAGPRSYVRWRAREINSISTFVLSRECQSKT